MKKVCISKDWLFNGGDGYKSIDLPHDYQVTKKRGNCGSPSNGYFPDTIGKYNKYIKLEGNRHYILDIDGAYMCARIYFNEQLLAMHPYGYTPFLVDLTPYVLDGITNKIAISISPIGDTSRWYTGNGIYRDVFLWEGGDTRIEPWDIFVSTTSIENNEALLRVKYTVSADEAAKVTVKFDVKKDDEVVKTEVVELDVKEGKNDFELPIKVESPCLWDTQNPNLYTLDTEIVKNNVVVDQSQTQFGIRTFFVSAKTGLLLNGNPIKLKGGCLHHDNGELGAAAIPAAEERKVLKLKSVGFNAIRSAHNPPSLAMLEACDRHGIIVMDEAFDMWNMPEKPYDYSLFFEDWWARDIAYMVLRDRNHPCVFSYSIGNEIKETNGTSRSAEISKRLADEVRKYDDTRAVTSAIFKDFSTFRTFEACDSVDKCANDPADYVEFLKNRFFDKNEVEINKAVEDYEAPLDIVGVNYFCSRYKLETEMYPDKVIWGSESKLSEFYLSWTEAMKYPNILGDFTWTAFDNLGEAGAGRAAWARDCEYPGEYLPIYGVKYPWRNCYQGDFDLCGFRRPQSYYRESMWRENTEPRIFVTHPEHFGEDFYGTGWHWFDVDECWTFDDCYVGRPVKAEVYTSADKIKWYVNDKFVGESSPKKGIATIETIYQKGSITAVAYKNDTEYSRYTLYSTNKASALEVEPEKNCFEADGRDLCYVPVTLVDNNGRRVYNDERLLKCSVHRGELVAFFSGDPMTEDDVNSNQTHTFKGKAMAIIRTTMKGNVSVTVYGDGVCAQTVEIEAK